MKTNSWTISSPGTQHLGWIDDSSSGFSLNSLFMWIYGPRTVSIEYLPYLPVPVPVGGGSATGDEQKYPRPPRVKALSSRSRHLESSTNRHWCNSKGGTNVSYDDAREWAVLMRAQMLFTSSSYGKSHPRCPILSTGKTPLVSIVLTLESQSPTPTRPTQQMEFDSTAVHTVNRRSLKTKTSGTDMYRRRRRCRRCQ
jgi:hypothetical protein